MNHHDATPTTIKTTTVRIEECRNIVDQLRQIGWWLAASDDGRAQLKQAMNSFVRDDARNTTLKLKTVTDGTRRYQVCVHLTNTVGRQSGITVREL